MNLSTANLLMDTKLSVIIPYYNSEKWISKCLDSLLKQDFKEEEFEIILVDDGSNNSTVVLDQYLESHQNIKYIKQENKGQSAARNRGERLATGEYLFFCDSDDFVTENTLRRIYDLAKSHDADAVFYNRKQIKENGIPNPILNFNSIQVYEPGINMILTPPYKVSAGPWEFFIKKDFINREHISFNEEATYREDYLFYLQMIMVARKVLIVDADVYYWVQHSSSVTHLKSKNRLSKIDSICNGIIIYVEYLVDLKKKLLVKDADHIKTIEAIKWLQDRDIYTLLLLYFKYFSLKENIIMIKHLKSIGAYPISLHFFNNLKFSHESVKYLALKMFGRVMKIFPMWITVCACYHCLPKMLRKRI